MCSRLTEGMRQIVERIYQRIGRAIDLTGRMPATIEKPLAGTTEMFAPIKRLAMAAPGAVALSAGPQKQA